MNDKPQEELKREAFLEKAIETLHSQFDTAAAILKHLNNRVDRSEAREATLTEALRQARAALATCCEVSADGGWSYDEFVKVKAALTTINQVLKESA